MQEQLRIAIPVIGPAMLAAAVAMFVAWRPWRRDGLPLWGGFWGPAIACGVSIVVAFVLASAWPTMPPRERWQWMAFIAIACTLIGLVAAVWRPRGSVSAAIGLASAIVAGLMLQPPRSIEQPWLWKGGLTVVAFALWLVLEPLAQRRRGAALPLAIWAACAGASMVLLHSGFAVLSLTAAGLAAAFGAMAITAWLNPRVSLGHGAIYITAAAIPAMMSIGWFYRQAEVPLASFALIAAAPIAAWLGELQVVRQRRSWQAALITLCTTAIPVAIAVAMAAMAAAGEEEHLY